ncbi:hypothetical protein [Microcoleus sp. F4-D5]|uniref:hypothetical protein n=1 Tax=Microcoleus sp. F4-D5 TaxID=2818760 RepID=UPI002FD1E92B
MSISYSQRVRGGLGWSKKFTTPARIAISAPKKLAQPKSQSRTDNPIALPVRSAILNNDASDRYWITCSRSASDSIDREMLTT